MLLESIARLCAKKTKSLLVFCCFFSSFYSFGLWNLLNIGDMVPVKSSLTLPTGTTEKQDRLAVLQKDVDDLKNNSQEKLKKINADIAAIENSISHLKEKIAHSANYRSEVADKELATLNESHQLLLAMQFTYERIITLAEQHIALLKEYVEDPYFEGLTITTQALYSFKDYQKANKMILAQNEKIHLLKEQKSENESELEGTHQKLASVRREYEIKKKEQQDFAAKSTVPSPDFDRDLRDQGTLLDIQKDYYTYEKRFFKLKIEEFLRKIDFLTTSLSIEQEKRKVLKDNLEKIRRSLRIDQQDILEAREKLEMHKKDSLAAQESYYQTIKNLVAKKNDLIRKIEEIKKQSHASIEITGLNFSDWSSLPKNSEQLSYACQLGMYREQLQAIETNIDLLTAAVDLEKVQRQYEKIDIDILVSWAELMKRKGRTIINLSAELKKYQSLMSEYERKIITFKEKKNATSNLLDIQHKNLNAIKTATYEIKTATPNGVKPKKPEPTSCQFSLAAAQTAITEQIDTLAQLLQTYAATLDALHTNIHQINTIINELEKKNIWQRSEYAISASGLRNSLSDFSYFLYDTQLLAKAYLASFSLESTKKTIREFIAEKYAVVRTLLWLLLLATFLLLFHFILRLLMQRLYRHTTENKKILLTTRLLAILVEFIKLHYLSIFGWVILLSLIVSDFITEPIIEIAFYLTSILYGCYLTNRLVTFAITKNRQQEYLFFRSSYEPRFIMIVSLLGYASSILLLTREAFIAGMYYTSEVPTILLAGYSIILRALLIFSIGKDELILLIPSRSLIGQTLTRLINGYYYPLLAIILLLMILSDPYVGGYGNLVSYILWGIIGSFVLLKLLFWLQVYLKQAATHLFMYTDDETTRERFSHARTWYGALVVTLSLVFLIVGLILCLKIWGHDVSWQDLKSWFEYELFSTGFDAGAGKYIKFTPQKFFVAVGIILAGFLSSVVINRFIVHRVFQLVPVDLGIQHMVTSLTHYLVLILAIFIGFQWAGLGTLLLLIGVVIGSITYLVREPLADFLSYFILLIQRPVKIGDLVMIGQELGFVRQMTPRSVILRSKNSYTLIVPNTSFISQTLRNWNYTRGYVAFDDITVTIPYSIDPIKVKEIIVELLQSSTKLLKIPAPIVRLENFGENGYEFLVRGFISSDKTIEIWDIASDVRLQLVKALRAHNITIAVPTRAIFKMSTHTLSNQDKPSSLFNVPHDTDLED